MLNSKKGIAKLDFNGVRKYCQNKPEVVEDYPFDIETLVFKVCGKMFALLGEKFEVPSINLKCEPQQALMLRDMYPAVKPGYHMNKKHWNTVLLDDSIPEVELMSMIDHSYALVVKGLKKSERQSLEVKYGREEIYGVN